MSFCFNHYDKCPKNLLFVIRSTSDEKDSKQPFQKLVTFALSHNTIEFVSFRLLYALSQAFFYILRIEQLSNTFDCVSQKENTLLNTENKRLIGVLTGLENELRSLLMSVGKKC
jgi:hypothetical protein